MSFVVVVVVATTNTTTTSTTIITTTSKSTTTNSFNFCLSGQLSQSYYRLDTRQVTALLVQMPSCHIINSIKLLNLKENKIRKICRIWQLQQLFLSVPIHPAADNV